MPAEQPAASGVPVDGSQLSQTLRCVGIWACSQHPSRRGPGLGEPLPTGPQRVEVLQAGIGGGAA